MEEKCEEERPWKLLGETVEATENGGEEHSSPAFECTVDDATNHQAVWPTKMGILPFVSKYD